MAAMIDPGESVFLDTSFAVALAAPTDQLHARATRLAGELESASARLITTRAILFEIGNTLARRRYRKAAVALLESLESDPTVTIESVTDALYTRAFALFGARSDKEWGLIDCLSFDVMRDRGLTKALTADEHFQQAGFRALLRETRE